ncbi:MAG: hypothetical protein CMJ77_12340 [Planctomycetaceae bacterium]|nr:hypothetical protein [Planctomycetaceae bacterium]
MAVFIAPSTATAIESSLTPEHKNNALNREGCRFNRKTEPLELGSWTRSESRGRQNHPASVSLADCV